MLTTDKRTCRMIAEALEAYGVREAVCSPGSRNTPMLMALARSGGVRTHTVVDERSAGFIALGMGQESGAPVALCCTSGTAMLNYGPALAEAYYSRIPLVAITADRPAEWIDQADSQTIRQPGALPTVVKGCFNLKGEISDNEQGATNRIINDALTLALTEPRGPVQINLSLSQPLTTEADIPTENEFRKIETVTIEGGLHNAQARAIAEQLAGKRTMIVCGPITPSHKLTKAMGMLAGLPNVVIMAEPLSNLHITTAHKQFEPILPKKGECGELAPEIVISCGGALVSAKLKSYLRQTDTEETWHIGREPYAVDTFGKLTARMTMTPEEFFPKIAGALGHLTRTGENKSDYAKAWREHAATRAASLKEDREQTLAQWNATAAMAQIFNVIPSEWNIQLSNGMTVREAMQLPTERFHRLDCNRGVSGIDGSTSTAIGASALYKGTTLLISGDMSFQYDIGALTTTLLTPRLKTVVINNGGGGIFSYVRSSAKLPEKEEMLQTRLRLPLKELCGAWGIDYRQANNASQLAEVLPEFIGNNDRPTLIEIITDAEADAEALRHLQNI